MQTLKDYNAGKKRSCNQEQFCCNRKQACNKGQYTHLMNAADFFWQGQVEKELLAVQDPSGHHQ